MKRFLLFLTILLLFLACRSAREMSGNSDLGCTYQLQRLKATSSDSALIFGKILLLKDPSDTDNFEKVVRIDDQVFKTNIYGVYRIKLAPGIYHITGVAMSYNPMEIPNVHLQQGDSIKINFAITANTEPLHD
ncbi:hypothetical protein [Olivibacter domesticus]|uniref:Carboxypeptidase regulatory-like domain-containing protein n=1 Tax=Olivibacter domesticus TaxID=407022 RepID=A0A1H7IKP1_OLID1|nr:hypothetical protein [Olivibacter domesticus]SEK62130.1 hypothetical protein SAMN05661044_00712 [Olivibacter domesticus]